MAKTFDSGCFELAEKFLSDVDITDKATIQQLAQEIQGLIEDFLNDCKEG